MTIKFGPAGLGSVADAEKVLEQYKNLGFKICEIAFTYSVYIKSEDAKRIGKKAKELGIELTIHAPYFINLNSSEKEKVEASKKRILKCCEIGEELGAKRVVFHPGYYGKTSREETYFKIKKEITEIVNYLKIKISPETMGKINVFGSPEEISQLVKDTGCDFCIDFAHILAREKKVDYNKIKKLFPQEHWHCHFSGIVYGEKGEKHHKTTEKKEWKELFKNLPGDKEINIVCESPTLIEDSVEGMKIWKKIKI
ncbi:TIM barrel protein [Candidatus Pacearchaeota archaeon]|nr:TIM barrel protein [Candidatus Pacearchaeota archaeon]